MKDCLEKNVQKKVLIEKHISFEDKRKAADGLISSISATSDYVKIEWKI